MIVLRIERTSHGELDDEENLIDYDEMLKELGITQKDLDAVGDVRFG